jgi:hypothetical protein
MRRVLKYPLGSGQQFLSLGQNPKIVLFEVQNSGTYVWVETDEYPYAKQTILQIFVTGENIPDNGRHIASCKSDERGTYIWHLYELLY